VPPIPGEVKIRTRVYVNALYGADCDRCTDMHGQQHPNGGTVRVITFLNGGNKVLHCQKIKGKTRVDVVNVTDNSYFLRDGGGIGVNAGVLWRTARLLGSVSFVSEPKKIGGLRLPPGAALQINLYF